MKLLGIDVGTGGTRALLIDTQGNVCASTVREHAVFRSPQPGWAEQDPKDWWHATAEAIRALLHDSATPADEIAAVGLSGQMHGAVLLDEANRVLRPSLIWCDQRTAAEAGWLTETLGADRLIALTSNPALTNFTLTKLLWVRTHERDVWRRFRSFLLPKDYVRLQLTGERAMDVADASGTLLLDVAHRRWSREMLDAVEMPETMLPRLYECQEIAGRITPEAAAATGLRAGTPVVAGAGDQAAGALGMGIVRPGDASATIGTSGVVFAATDKPLLDPHGRLHTFCHAIPGRWHVMGVTQAAGLSLRWFRDAFADTTDTHIYARLSEAAAEIPAGADGLLWAPYLMGERTPHLDPLARGALVGLTPSHRSAHIVRAIMEGVAFSLKDTLRIFAEIGVPARAIRLGGGGARSPLWRQIQADVYAQPVEVVSAEEGAAYGAALLAGVGAQIWPSVDAACDTVVTVAQRITPRAAESATLERYYALYRQLYPSLRPLFHGLHDASRRSRMPEPPKDLHQTPEATLAEFAAKRDRLVAAMAATGLAAVQMQRTENVAWLTAGRVDRRVLLPSATGIASVLVLRSGECFYLAPDNEACRLAEEDFAGLPFTPVTAPWHSSDFADQLSRLTGGGSIAEDSSPDYAPLFKSQRATLVDTEIERYRWLARNTAQVVSQVLQALEPGVTERTMAARISAGLMERGIEPSVLLMAVDDRILRYKHAVAQNAPLERFAMLNLCSRRWGLCTSITRFTHFGSMPQALVDAFAVAAEVNAHLLSSTRDGATSAELFATAAATYASLGHPGEELRHHQGGATGYGEREWVATPSGSERVCDRQAFAWNPSVAGGKAEDTVLLRGGDLEMLTATPDLPTVTHHVDGRTIESAGVLVR